MVGLVGVLVENRDEAGGEIDLGDARETETDAAAAGLAVGFGGMVVFDTGGMSVSSGKGIVGSENGRAEEDEDRKNTGKKNTEHEKEEKKGKEATL